MFFHNDVTEQFLYQLSKYKETIPTTPSERPTKVGWKEIFKGQSITCQNSKASLLLIGDSIVAGLGRYKRVKEIFFEAYSTINCGIGGDHTQNVLWRCENMIFPPSLNHIVVHCGSNNIQKDSPQDIASGIVMIGLTARKKCPSVNVIITSILPKVLKWSKM